MSNDTTAPVQGAIAQEHAAFADSWDEALKNEPAPTPAPPIASPHTEEDDDNA